MRAGSNNYYPRSRKAEAGGLRDQSELGLHTTPISKQKKTNQKPEKATTRTLEDKLYFNSFPFQNVVFKK